MEKVWFVLHGVCYTEELGQGIRAIPRCGKWGEIRNKCGRTEDMCDLDGAGKVKHHDLGHLLKTTCEKLQPALVKSL